MPLACHSKVRATSLTVFVAVLARLVIECRKAVQIRDSVVMSVAVFVMNVPSGWDFPPVGLPNEPMEGLAFAPVVSAATEPEAFPLELLGGGEDNDRVWHPTSVWAFCQPLVVRNL